MKNLNRALDTTRKVLDHEDLEDIDGHDNVSIDQGDSTDESIYGLLVDKTESEAALRVNSGEPGHGMQAYMRLYVWFSGTTGLALTEMTRSLMHPSSPKHDHEIADALERWAEQERSLRAHGTEYSLSAAYKVTALRIIMTCRREQFEFMERESRSLHGE